MAIEAELCRKVKHPQTSPDQADHLTVGIDGAFVKAKREGKQGRQHFEILTGRIERERGRGEAFAIVRDLDGRAKQKIQAVLRRAGRTAETAITVLSDGEDGLRGVVGWFGRKCEHRLDWFHVSRRLDRIHKLLLYLPSFSHLRLQTGVSLQEPEQYQIPTLEQRYRNGGLGHEDLSRGPSGGCLGLAARVKAFPIC